MSFVTLRQAVATRLDEGDRGDRGWWLLTRMHVSLGRLVATATYLNDAGFASPKDVTSDDYEALAQVIETTAADPRQGINRHLFLAMDTPLSLISRPDGRLWKSIQLTDFGVQLATSQNPVRLFDHLLDGIIFAEQPWYPARRVQEYHDFAVRPYEAAINVTNASNGWIDRDEYDLFLSRVRNGTEYQWAIDCIAEYRELGLAQQALLLKEVEHRIPSPKTYSNWRDMGLHTFSFLSLGSALLRNNRLLVRTGTQVEEGPGQPESEPTPRPPRQPGRPRGVLRLPQLGDDPSLQIPPVAPAANVGTEGELLVGKMLQAQGWNVTYYSNRRGYGFDIWASRQGQAALFEVKSSLQTFGSVTLTQTEFASAQQHGDNYVLVIVEEVESENPVLYTIVNPAHSLAFTETNAIEHTAARGVWWPHVSPFFGE